MRKNLALKSLVLTLLLFASFVEVAMAAGLNFSFALPYSMFTKTSDDGTVSGSTPLGIEANAKYFLANRWSLNGTIEVNLESSKMTPVFLGGDGTLAYYISGGSTHSISLESFSAHSAPRFISAIFVGGGGRAFNFNAFDASTGKVVKRALNNQSRGSFIGPTAGIFLSFRMAGNVYAVSQFKIVKGLSDEVTPAIMITGGSLGLEVAL